MPRTIRTSKFFWLLLSLLAFFVITPFIVDSRIDMYVFSVLFSIILFVSACLITHNRWLIVTGVVLALLIFIGLWVNNLFVGNRDFLGVEYVLTILFFLMITVVVLRAVIKDNIISFNTLCGAVCGYLLIGLVWSFFYSLILNYYPTAFNVPDTGSTIFDSHFQRFTYYSYVTLTTLGYGDITPSINIAKTLAWLEAVAGQVYLTVWLAQLVGLHIIQRDNKRKVSE